MIPRSREKLVPPSTNDVTGWLVAWRDGDQTALDKLVPVIYRELHRLAQRHMRRERGMANRGQTLETTLVHLIERQMPTNHVCVPAEIPEELIEWLPDADLPKDWRSNPISTARIGSKWCESAKLPVLSVPSVVIPRERNYLIRPSHQDRK